MIGFKGELFSAGLGKEMLGEGEGEGKQASLLTGELGFRETEWGRRLDRPSSGIGKRKRSTNRDRGRQIIGSRERN